MSFSMPNCVFATRYRRPRPVTTLEDRIQMSRLALDTSIPIVLKSADTGNAPILNSSTLQIRAADGPSDPGNCSNFIKREVRRSALTHGLLTQGGTRNYRTKHHMYNIRHTFDYTRGS